MKDWVDKGLRFPWKALIAPLWKKNICLHRFTRHEITCPPKCTNLINWNEWLIYFTMWELTINTLVAFRDIILIIQVTLTLAKSFTMVTCTSKELVLHTRNNTRQWTCDVSQVLRSTMVVTNLSYGRFFLSIMGSTAWKYDRKNRLTVSYNIWAFTLTS